jgi:hypothetical protein
MRSILSAVKEGRSAVASGVINVNEVLDGHVGLELDCLDQIYVNAYVPRMQTAGRWRSS